MAPAGRALSLLLYSPAQDEGHIKWPSLRAELAINLSRCPRSPGACGYLVVASGSLFGTGLIFFDARRSRLIWDGGIPRPPFRRPRSAASLRSLRAALENALRFLGSAPLRVRNPPHAHKKAPWAVMGSGRSVLMAGTEGFEPPTAGTKNRSSTVELRPSTGVAQKQLV